MYQFINPLYNQQQIQNFSNYFLNPKVIPLIQNKQFSLSYIIIDNQTNIPYTKFHHNINSFLNIKPTPNNINKTQQLPSSPTPEEPPLPL